MGVHVNGLAEGQDAVEGERAVLEALVQAVRGGVRVVGVGVAAGDFRGFGDVPLGADGGN